LHGPSIGGGVSTFDQPGHDQQVSIADAPAVATPVVPEVS